MEIKRAGSQPSAKGSSEWFTGNVRIDPLFQTPDPALVQSASVTFEPGARTAWHTHPLGQTLIVTAGYGWVQRDGGPVEEIRPGDVVWFAPGEKHWHGATAINGMTHIAIQEKLNGKVVEWLEHVTDQHYLSGENNPVEEQSDAGEERRGRDHLACKVFSNCLRLYSHQYLAVQSSRASTREA
jgi:quercetin dioxygenase-like cupin family protein